MNEVDEDNNIVGDQPFYGMTFPSKESSTKEIVRFVLMSVLILMILSGLVYGIYYLYQRYMKSSKSKKSKKEKKKSADQERYRWFNDEESHREKKSSIGDDKSTNSA